MRRALLGDVAELLRLNMKSIKVEPAPIDYAYERENHFKHLQLTWESKLNFK
jgi:hypothetical protein